MFGTALSDSKIQDVCKKYDDKTRKIIGVPDYPYSLMEGISGDICFLSDLLRDDDDTRFPAFEI